MEPIVKPLCHQISSIRIISKQDDNDIIFMVGSYLEKRNSLSLYRYTKSSDQPDLLHMVGHIGDVCDIQYNKLHQRALTCNSSGSINVYGIDSNGKLNLEVGWDKISHNNSPLSGAIFYDDNIVCVSEAGDIVSIKLETATQNFFPLKVKVSAAVRCVERMSESSNNMVFCTGGIDAIRIWDIRQSVDKPVWCAAARGGGVQCMAIHPGQPATLVCGGGSSKGLLTAWDIRGVSEEPQGLLEMPGVIWSLRFCPKKPNDLLIGASATGLALVSSPEWTTPKLETIIGGPRASITCLDVVNETVIAGSDKEMLCIVSPIH